MQDLPESTLRAPRAAAWVASLLAVAAIGVVSPLVLPVEFGAAVAGGAIVLLFVGAIRGRARQSAELARFLEERREMPVVDAMYRDERVVGEPRCCCRATAGGRPSMESTSGTPAWSIRRRAYGDTDSR